MSSKPIAVGDMVAFPVEGIYVTGRATRIMPAGVLVKTNEGHLQVTAEAVPMRDQAESVALIRRIAGLP